MSVRNAFLISVVASLVCTGLASGQSGDPIDEQLDRMRREMEQIRRENAAMRDEIDELRAVTGDNWLTERRADEIRELVGDILLDAEMRTSLLDGMTAGWSDHFFLASPDGRFKLQLEGQVQILFAFQYQRVKDSWRQGFENTRTKLVFRGHVFDPSWEYFIRGGFRREALLGPGSHGGSAIVGGEMALQDAWIRHHFDNSWSIRAGQFKLPFNREELVSSAHQQAVERSLVNESMNLGRSQGIELTYAGERQKFMVAVSDGGHDQLAGFNSLVGTMPANMPAIFLDDVEYAVTGRYEYLVAGSWTQFDDFTSQVGDPYGVLLGIAAHYQKDEYGVITVTPDENQWAAWTADVSIEWGGANLFASFTQHHPDNTTFGIFTGYGVVLQGGVYLSPKWEFFARYEWGQWDTPPGVTFEDVNLLTIGCVYYIDGHDLKWTTDVGYAFDQIGTTWDSSIAQWRSMSIANDIQVVLRTQLQLLF